MVIISDETIRRIQIALSGRGVKEVRIKMEHGEVIVLAVHLKKVE